MTLSHDLADTMRGDLEAFSRLLSQPHEAILRARGEVPALVVTRDAVRTVLEALRRRRITPEQAQQWAFFVRHGFMGRWVTPDPSVADAEAVPSAHREGIAELEIDTGNHRRRARDDATQSRRKRRITSSQKGR